MSIMQTAAARTIQVNTRVNAEEKLRADEVLTLMGSSMADLIRSVIGKVSRGAQDYHEVMHAVMGEDAASKDSLLLEAWAIADGFYRSLGIDPQSVPVDTRSWEEIYEEAMDDHFIEKGLML